MPMSVPARVEVAVLALAPAPPATTACGSIFLFIAVILRPLPTVIETWMHRILLTARGSRSQAGSKGGQRASPRISESKDAGATWQWVSEARLEKNLDGPGFASVGGSREPGTVIAERERVRDHAVDGRAGLDE